MTRNRNEVRDILFTSDEGKLIKENIEDYIYCSGAVTSVIITLFSQERYKAQLTAWVGNQAACSISMPPDGDSSSAMPTLFWIITRPPVPFLICKNAEAGVRPGEKIVQDADFAKPRYGLHIMLQGIKRWRCICEDTDVQSKLRVTADIATTLQTQYRVTTKEEFRSLLHAQL